MDQPSAQEGNFRKPIPTTINGVHSSPLMNGHSGRKILVDPYSKKGDYATVEDVQALGLHPSDIDLISKCDQHDDLKMFHFRENYTEIKVETRVEEDFDKPLKLSWADMEDEKRKREEELKSRISAIRGWILQGTTVVSKSFSETTIVHLSPSELSVYDQKGYIFTPFLEGTTLRIFWYKDRWLHTTNRRIDCTNSRIPGVEIGFLQMFKEACPDFNYDLLNKNMIYIFQIVHVHNQLMNQEVIDRPKLYHLATIFGPSTPYPMKILDSRGNSPDNSGYCLKEKLPGVSYLETLSFDEAQGLLQIRKCVIARRGYEIIQLAPKSIERLMRIRSYEKTPFVPVPLLYLQLSLEDRPLLIDAMPPHQKHAANEEVMEQYIQNNASRLATFCAQQKASKMDKTGVKIPKSLFWLLNRFVFENQSPSYDEVRQCFLDYILQELAMTKGDTFYRCVKELDNMEDSKAKKASKNSGEYSYEPEVFPVLKSEPPAKNHSPPNKTRRTPPKKTRTPPKKVDNFNVDQAFDIINRRNGKK
jgi:hypothetical protein